MTRLAFVWVATILIAAFGLVGCNPPPDLTPIPGQEAFMADAWTRGIGRADAPPPVEWIRGADLNCDDGQGFRWADDASVCVDGEAPSDGFVRIALPNALPDWDTLCHELEHNALQRMGLPNPVDHAGFDFAKVESCASMLASLHGEVSR